MEETPKICLTGKYEKTVDKKRRVNIPALLMNQITDNTFHITKGQDHNLIVYPKEIFVTYASKLNKRFGSQGQKDQDKRVHFLDIMEDAQPVQSDQQGRIPIPQPLLEYAKITNKVVIIGGFDKFVLWDPDTYAAFKQSTKMSPQERLNEFGWADQE